MHHLRFVHRKHWLSAKTMSGLHPVGLPFRANVSNERTPAGASGGQRRFETVHGRFGPSPIWTGPSLEVPSVT